jgi:predicted O-methyltransferase YrrM
MSEVEKAGEPVEVPGVHNRAVVRPRVVPVGTAPHGAHIDIPAQVREAARTVVGKTRWLRERTQLQKVSVTGQAPTAVIAALKAASHGRPEPEEWQWIDRIETMRSLLLSSPRELSIVDFGAGAESKFDTGSFHTEHRVVKTLGAMTRASKRPQWAYVLFRIVRALQPNAILELGSCVGISACYLGAALELNGAGSVVTIEGAGVLAERSVRTIDEMDLSHRVRVVEGRFADALPGVMTEIAPIGLTFIDGHHIESATIEYKDAIAPAAADEAVLVFDDINWSDGMRKAWASIVDDPRFALTVDLGTVGLAVISASATGPRQSLEMTHFRTSGHQTGS